MNPTLFVNALVRTSLEAGVLVLIVLAVQRVFRRQLAPSWTCALWLLVVLRLLPISFASSVSVFNWLPRWFEPPAIVQKMPPAQIGRASASPSAAVFLSGRADPRGSAALPSTSAADDAASAPATIAAGPAAASQSLASTQGWTPGHILLTVWLTGVVVLGGCVGWESLRFRHQLAELKPVDHPGILAVLRDSCDRLAVRRQPPVHESSAIKSPALYGLSRPRLLLPLGFASRFSSEEMRFVFLHELAHVKRLDLPLNWLVTLLQIVHWFNPLVWLGFARWRIDREIACDAQAIAAAGAETSQAYGRTLLRLLENLALPMSRPGLVGIVESKGQLQRRMRMIAGYSGQKRSSAALALATGLAVIGLTDAQTDPTPGAVNPTQSTATTPTPGFGTSAGSPYALASAPRLVDGRDPVSGVSLRGERVLFLVNTSASMLGDTAAEAFAAWSGQSWPETPPAEAGREPDAAPKNRGAERGRTIAIPSGLSTRTDAEKRSAPKWQRSLQALRWMLAALGPEQQFQIIAFNDRAGALPANSRLNGWIGTQDPAAAAEVLSQLDELVPQGGANLEAALTLAGQMPALPDNIVLITDGLPTRSDSSAFLPAVDPDTRLRYFEAARRRLPARIPIQTILLPLDGDPGAAGLYWELANATRGSLITPAKSWPALERESVLPATGSFTPIGLVPDATHLAIIVDTSGSMRDPNRGGLWWDVTRAVGVILDAHPQLAGVQLFDGDGRFILGDPGIGVEPWLAVTPALRDRIAQALSGYSQDSISNPVPGIRSALSALYSNRPDMRIACYLIGDEFIDVAAPALRQLDELNPADVSGNRKVTINAVGLPTTIRFRFSMGQTGVKFAHLMRTVTGQHGGAFIALQDLSPPDGRAGRQAVGAPPSGQGQVRYGSSVGSRITATINDPANPRTPEEAERLAYERAFHQALARKRAGEARTWAKIQEDALALAPEARFNALLAETDAMVARAEFRAAARALKTTLDAKPTGLPLPPAFSALEAMIHAQSAPVPVSIVSDQKTWISLFDLRPLGQFMNLKVDVPPGDYQLVGRRKGYEDVTMLVQVRTGAPPPTFTVICTVPAEAR